MYVEIDCVKLSGRRSGGVSWYDTDDVLTAITQAMRSVETTWDILGYEPVQQYSIVVATEDSLGQRTPQGYPLPLRMRIDDYDKIKREEI